MSESTTTPEAIPGYTTKTIRHGNCTITIHRPILSQTEREKRERRVVTALAQYGRSLSNK